MNLFRDQKPAASVCYIGIGFYPGCLIQGVVHDHLVLEGGLYCQLYDVPTGILEDPSRASRYPKPCLGH